MKRENKWDGDFRSPRMLGSLVHWFIEWGNTCLNQDTPNLRIFRIVAYRTLWATILLDLAIQQEQIEKTSLQMVTVYGGYGIRCIPTTIYLPKAGTHKGCPYRCGVALGGNRLDCIGNP